MKAVFLITAFALLGACSALDSSSSAPQQPLSMYRHYGMVDQQGNVVGSVTFKPVGHGEIHDTNGQLIGIITNP